MNKTVLKMLTSMLEPLAIAEEDQGLDQLFAADTTPDKTRYKSTVSGGISLAEGLKTVSPAGTILHDFMQLVEDECKANLAKHNITL